MRRARLDRPPGAGELSRHGQPSAGAPGPRHRRTLTRDLGRSLFGGLACQVNWILLNPSEAGERAGEGEDPTSTKIIGFSALGGCTRLVGTNMFTRRATKPSMLHPGDLNVPDADAILRKCMEESDIVVAAFGSGAGLKAGVPFLERARHIVDLAGELKVTLRCIGRTAAGWPRHPLYAPYPRRAIAAVDDVFPVWEHWKLM